MHLRRAAQFLNEAANLSQGSERQKTLVDWAKQAISEYEREGGYPIGDTANPVSGTGHVDGSDSE